MEPAPVTSIDCIVGTGAPTGTGAAAVVTGAVRDPDRAGTTMDVIVGTADATVGTAGIAPKESDMVAFRVFESRHDSNLFS